MAESDSPDPAATVGFPAQAAGLPGLHLPAGLDRGQRLLVLRGYMRQRWQDGAPIQVEEILHHFSEQAADTEGVLDLIYQEIVLREEQGQAPQLDQYLARFPEMAAGLRRQFALHQALAEGSLQAAPEVPTEYRPPEEMQLVSPPPNATAPCTEDPEVPGYEILGVLGRGGMGVVYKARQRSLKRTVALKMILAGVHAGPKERARFEAEALAVARLQHPHIVQIHEVGAHQGCAYFSLEYVDGGTLARRCAGRPQLARLAAELIETLARAVHYAHQQGVIHRDLKPSNVLLAGEATGSSGYGKSADAQSGVAAPPRASSLTGKFAPFGTPKITDFGLAKQLDTGDQPTVSGAILGTPAYMAPEQAGGRNRDIGPATDVYALGVILYELLTGQPPFQGQSVWETLEKVRVQDPPPIDRGTLRVPRDLETICFKCLEKEPSRRYASAEALAEDLRAFLSGEPIQARPQTKWEKTIRRLRRRPGLTLLLSIGGVAVIGLGVGSLWYNVLAVSAVAVVSLVAGGGWYYTRLQAALSELAHEHHAAERQVERLHLLLEMTHQLVRTPDRDTVLRLISETTARLANAERSTVFVVDRAKKEIWSKVALGEGVGEIRLPLGEGIAGTVAQTGRMMHLPDAYAHPKFNPDVDRRTGYRTRNLLALPLRGPDSKVIGVLQVLNKRGGPFLPDDVEMLTGLGAAAAVALERTCQT